MVFKALIEAFKLTILKRCKEKVLYTKEDKNNALTFLSQFQPI